MTRGYGRAVRRPATNQRRRPGLAALAGIVAAVALLGGCAGQPTPAEARERAEEVLATYGIALLPAEVAAGPTESEVRACTSGALQRVRVRLDVPAGVDHVAALAAAWQDRGEVTRSAGDAYLERDGYTRIAIADAGGGGPVLQVESPCVDDG